MNNCGVHSLNGTRAIFITRMQADFTPNEDMIIRREITHSYTDGDELRTQRRDHSLVQSAQFTGEGPMQVPHVMYLYSDNYCFELRDA